MWGCTEKGGKTCEYDLGGTAGLQEDADIPISTPSCSDVELVCDELLRGSRRLIRSRLSLLGFSRSSSVVILRACLNSCPPDVVLPSLGPAALERDWATGGARTVRSSGVFLPCGRGMVMLPGVEGSRASGTRLEISQLGEWASGCTGIWTDGGLSEGGGAQRGKAVSS